MMSLEQVKRFRPVKFKYIGSDERFHLGVIAQDIMEVYPIDKYAIVIKDTKTGYLKVDYIELIAPLIKAVQELDNKVNLLQKELQQCKEITNE